MKRRISNIMDFEKGFTEDTKIKGITKKIIEEQNCSEHLSDYIDNSIEERLSTLEKKLAEQEKLINAIDAERADELINKLREEKPEMFKDKLFEELPLDTKDFQLATIIGEKIMSSNKLPTIIPDENTPVGTVVIKQTGCLGFFSRLYTEGAENIPVLDNGFWLYNNPLEPIEKYYKECVIDIEADLQFRAFLNAPKEYRWFTIDDNAMGHVFIDKPILQKWMDLGGERETWEDLESSGIIGVGLFPQYKHLYKEILIERKD